MEQNLAKKYTDLKKKYGFKKLFIDSGAFGAFTRGLKINIEQYIYFIKQCNCDYYACLDVINSAERTKENLKYMESKGLKPIPVFHYGEDMIYLKEYCEKYEYVGLGGVAMLQSRPELLKTWLDRIFHDYPKTKFHGFATTSFKIMKNYPWYSVDSSTFNVGEKFKQLVTPFGRIQVGENTEYDNHITKLQEGKLERLKELCERLNWDINTFYKMKEEENYIEANKFNIEVYEDFEKRWEEPKINNIQIDLGKFDSEVKTAKLGERISFEKDKSIQQTFLNMNLIKLTKKIWGHKYLCVLCEYEFEKEGEKLIAQCPKCGKNVTKHISEISSEVEECR